MKVNKDQEASERFLISSNHVSAFLLAKGFRLSIKIQLLEKIEFKNMFLNNL